MPILFLLGLQDHYSKINESNYRQQLVGYIFCTTTTYSINFLNIKFVLLLYLCRIIFLCSSGSHGSPVFNMSIYVCFIRSSVPFDWPFPLFFSSLCSHIPTSSGLTVHLSPLFVFDMIACSLCSSVPYFQLFLLFICSSFCWPVPSFRRFPLSIGSLYLLSVCSFHRISMNACSPRQSVPCFNLWVETPISGRWISAIRMSGSKLWAQCWGSVDSCLFLFIAT